VRMATRKERVSPGTQELMNAGPERARECYRSSATGLAWAAVVQRTAPFARMEISLFRGAMRPTITTVGSAGAAKRVSLLCRAKVELQGFSRRGGLWWVALATTRARRVSR
jgi:hypothetical protein